MACTCSTCDHWHEGASPLATAAPGQYPLSKPDVGTCQLYAPTLAETNWFPVSMYPETHADRTCGDWVPFHDPDPGEREAVPTGNVIPIERAA